LREIERLSQDLRTAFPEMKGFSLRNLKYMRAFAEAWPNGEFVQEMLAQLPWYHQLALLDKLPGTNTRKWYAAKAIEHNWSRNILVMQIKAGKFKPEHLGLWLSTLEIVRHAPCHHTKQVNHARKP